MLPLMRCALAVFFAGQGVDHPNSHTVMDNYAAVLSEMGHGEEGVLERSRLLPRVLLGQRFS